MDNTYVYLTTVMFKEGSTAGSGVTANTADTDHYFTELPCFNNDRVNPVLHLDGSIASRISNVNYALIKWPDELAPRHYFVGSKGVSVDNIVELGLGLDYLGTFSDFIYTSYGIVNSATAPALVDSNIELYGTNVPASPMPKLETYRPLTQTPFVLTEDDISRTSSLDTYGIVVLGTVLTEDVSGHGNTRDTSFASVGATRYYAMTPGSFINFITALNKKLASISLDVQKEMVKTLINGITDVKLLPLRLTQQTTPFYRRGVPFILDERFEKGPAITMPTPDGVNHTIYKVMRVKTDAGSTLETPVAVKCYTKYDSLISFKERDSWTARDLYVDDYNVACTVEGVVVVFRDYQCMSFDVNAEIIEELLGEDYYWARISLTNYAGEGSDLGYNTPKNPGYTPGTLVWHQEILSKTQLEECFANIDNAAVSNSLLIEPYNLVEISYGPFGTLQLPVEKLYTIYTETNDQALFAQLVLDPASGTVLMSLYGGTFKTQPSIIVARNLQANISISLSIPVLDISKISWVDILKTGIDAVGALKFGNVTQTLGKTLTYKKGSVMASDLTPESHLFTGEDGHLLSTPPTATWSQIRKVQQTKTYLGYADLKRDVKGVDVSSLISAANVVGGALLEAPSGVISTGSPVDNDLLKFSPDTYWIHHVLYEPLHIHEENNNDMYPVERRYKLEDWHGHAIRCNYIDTFGTSDIMPTITERKAVLNLLAAGIWLESGTTPTPPTEQYILNNQTDYIITDSTGYTYSTGVFDVSAMYSQEVIDSLQFTCGGPITVNDEYYAEETPFSFGSTTTLLVERSEIYSRITVINNGTVNLYGDAPDGSRAIIGANKNVTVLTGILHKLKLTYLTNNKLWRATYASGYTEDLETTSGGDNTYMLLDNQGSWVEFTIVEQPTPEVDVRVTIQGMASPYPYCQDTAQTLYPENEWGSQSYTLKSGYKIDLPKVNSSGSRDYKWTVTVDGVITEYYAGAATTTITLSDKDISIGRYSFINM